MLQLQQSMRRCARLGLASGPAVRRLATDAHAKGKKELVPIVPVWQTTSAFKTLSDLPSRDVLKAELLQMAEQKNGFLFGEVTRKWEDWEIFWYVGLGASFLYAAVGLYYKPDCKITTWARVEAMRRKSSLEEGGDDWLALMKEGGSAPPLDQ